MRFDKLPTWYPGRKAMDPQFQSDKISKISGPFGPYPMYLFIWLCICILYNKLENIRKVVPELCELC